MKKYRIFVNPPKAKRMRGTGKVIVTTEDGWNGASQKVFQVDEEKELVFEMPDEVPWRYNNSASDGPSFDLKLVYSNKDNTREEVYRPVPEEIKP
jgi:hypothetical protein